MIWLVVVMMAAYILLAVKFQSKDPDSKLYANIAAKMSQTPIQQWIAPEWWGNWQQTGLFREHPIGVFIFPALLCKLGYPAEQSAYVINALYQIFCLLLFYKLACIFCPAIEARSLLWILQLLPIAFTYRIRANHEQALLLGILLALYGLEKFRQRSHWIVLTICALVWLVLIKGILGLIGVIICLVWIILRGAGDEKKEWRIKALLGMSVAIVCIILTGIVYEAIYQAVCGESFLKYYLGLRLKEGLSIKGSFVTQKIGNLFFYTTRVVWFSFPWAFFFLLAVVLKTKKILKYFYDWKENLVKASNNNLLRGFILVSGIIFVYVVGLSFTDHKTDRYIFPAYFFVGAAGAVAAYHFSKKWQKLVLLSDQIRSYFPALLWLFLFVLNIISHILKFPYIKY